MYGNRRRALTASVVLLISFGAVVGAQGSTPPDERDFRMENVAANLDSPWSIAFTDVGRALVTLKAGELLEIDLKSGRKKNIGGIPRIRAVGQGGLLDVVPAPDFVSSRELFFSFSADSGGVQATAVARGRLPFGTDRLEDWRVIFTANNRTGGGFHFGSRLAFDRDGYLVVTVGERNERDRARNLRDHGGKVLRITREGRPAPNNPFLGRADALDEILSFGHRNPQGLAVHPMTGNIWMHEHGPRGGDEINIIRSGADYGWPLVTYGREYSGQQVGAGQSSAPGIEEPLLQWTPSIAPSGMAFIAGTLFPAWQGDLLVGALAGTELRLVELDGERVIGQKTYLKGWARIRDLRQAPDQSVYLITDGNNAGLWRLLPR